MYTATKSFERFRQPKSVEDEKKSVDNAVPKSTAYKTKWSCKVFEEWKQNRLVKSCTLEPGGLFTTKDFEEGVQSLDTAITDMSGCSLNYWLSKFVQEVSNSSGERYPSRSLYSIICGLKRHLKNEFPMNDKVEEKRVEKNFSIFEYVKFSDCEVNVFVNGLK